MKVHDYAMIHGIDSNMIYEAFRIAKVPIRKREYTEEQIAEVVRAELMRRMNACRQRIEIYETVMGRL